MALQLNLAVDAMGGDNGPKVVVPAAIRFLDENPGIELTLFGVQDELLRHFPNNDPAGISRCHAQFCSQFVADDESPSAALRHKQDSSMWLAFQAVAHGRSQAFISGGNTGAMVAMGLKLLGANEGIDRPAICTALPTRAGRCYLLDVGANVDCTTKQLHQLALMATNLVRVQEKIAKPSVALLNIGKESIKGNKVVKEAAELFNADASLNYAGFIEADELLSGRVDIVICDGFVGNVALKATEGAVANILDRLAVIGKRYSTADISAGVMPSLLDALHRELDPGSYNGAILLGLKGVTVKSHGSADVDGFCCALERAVMAVGTDASGSITNELV
ncbi:MAG: phosphate acyltransferase PlsX [Gammaproteobacteria bacterium]|nr:MAG: phosphate acyltransferase PlsX [Gammaproteobacteria bacterium]RLA54960.1 MAG: phosphate acyltransferase PlsX [Gammaproteobacteria bacterium]